jgi:hypothetical protein
MISPIRNFLNYLNPSGSGPSQRPILPRGQPEVASAPPCFYPVLQHLPSLRGSPGFSTSRQLPDLLWARKGEHPGQGSLEIRLRELHLPCLAKEERHVDAMAWTVITAHAGQCRRT